MRLDDERLHLLERGKLCNDAVSRRRAIALVEELNDGQGSKVLMSQGRALAVQILDALEIVHPT